MYPANLTDRAFAAYFRTGGWDQPANYSGEVAHEGRRYVVLRNARGVLAVYGVRRDGRLTRLEDWPEEVSRW